jgi:hypothetical protein
VVSRNSSVAVIGAGDTEGFTVFAGRRHGEKLEPLIAQIEEAGGRAVAHRMV